MSETFDEGHLHGLAHESLPMQTHLRVLGLGRVQVEVFPPVFQRRVHGLPGLLLESPLALVPQPMRHEDASTYHHAVPLVRQKEKGPDLL